MKHFLIAALVAAAVTCAYLLAPEASASTPGLAMAMMVLPAFNSGAVPRAVTMMPRADLSDPKAAIAALNQAFEEFKAAHDQKLKAKVDDAVLNDKIGKIDASLSNFQGVVDGLNAKIAAAAAGGSVIGDLPADPEYVKAFKAHMRKGDVQAAMTKGSDADGGYLAPVEWDRTITGKLKVISPIRAHARVITITTAGFKKLFTDRAVGSGWVGETASRPATSTPQLAQLDFSPGEIYANPAIAQQTLDDAASDLEQWLADEVDTEFARQEGIAFISGDGANKPFGILTYVTGAAQAAKHPWGAIQTVASGHASQVTADGFIDLFYSLPNELRGNAKLFVNRMTMSATRKLKDGSGSYLWQPSYSEGQPSTIGGEPVVEVPDLPNIAANNIVALYGDMAKTYLVVDRVGIRVLRDPFTNKPFVHFYTTKRVGGGVHDPEPMRALKVAAS